MEFHILKQFCALHLVEESIFVSVSYSTNQCLRFVHQCRPLFSVLKVVDTDEPFFVSVTLNLIVNLKKNQKTKLLGVFIRISCSECAHRLNIRKFRIQLVSSGVPAEHYNKMLKVYSNSILDSMASASDKASDPLPHKCKEPKKWRLQIYPTFVGFSSKRRDATSAYNHLSGTKHAVTFHFITQRTDQIFP